MTDCRARRCYSGGRICVLKKSDFHEALQERGIHVGIGSYGRTQSGKGLQILKGSLFYFFYGCTLRKKERRTQYRKVFWKKKSKKFTARTGGKFAVNDSFFGEKIC